MAETALANHLDPPDHIAILDFQSFTGLVEDRLRQEIKQANVNVPLGVHMTVLPGKL